MPGSVEGKPQPFKHPRVSESPQGGGGAGSQQGVEKMAPLNEEDEDEDSENEDEREEKKARRKRVERREGRRREGEKEEGKEG